MTPAVRQWLENLRDNMGWGDITLDDAERRVSESIVPVPLGRIGRVEEIAHIVCMIASPAAGYMTGTNIRVDGGQVQSLN